MNPTTKIKSSFRWLQTSENKGIVQLLFNYGYKTINADGKTKYLPLSYSTQITIEKEYWDDENEMVLKSNSYAKKHNNLLTEINDMAGDIYKNFVYNGINPHPDQIRKELNIKLGREAEIKEAEICLGVYEYFKQFILVAHKYNLTSGTIKGYGSMLVKLQDYQKARNTTFTFATFTENVFLDLMNFIKERGYFQLVKDVRVHKYYALNSLWNLNKMLKKFLGVANDAGIKLAIDLQSKNLSHKEEPSDNIYNDFEELQTLYNLDLVSLNRPKLEITRALHILSSYTGVRYSDNKRMK